MKAGGRFVPPVGRSSRFALALSLAALASLPAGASAGQLRSFELPSPLVEPGPPGATLSSDRTVPKVHLLLPDGYKAGGKRRYPVLWLLHGANGGPDAWLGRNDARQLTAGMRAIVVMPDGGVAGMYLDWWNEGLRGGPAWASYHLNLLRRTVERRYRIRESRRWHAIAGISMGGQGTLRYAAMLPGYFGSAVGFSAAFPDTQSEVMQFGLNVALQGSAPGVSYEAAFGAPSGPYAEGNSPQNLAANYTHTRIYLTSGDGTNCPEDPVTPGTELDAVTETFISGQQGPFTAAARAAGAEVAAVTTCGVHTFGVWDRAFPAARAWGFFRPVPERPRRWTYRTIAASGEMWGLRFRFAAPPETLVEFRRFGRRLAASGNGTVAIRGRRGCKFRWSLPFDKRLPRGCLGPAGKRGG
jgi:S-formylglutathione hydrolase FrmB